MVILRPMGFKPSKYVANPIVKPDDYKVPAFVIHPPTSQLADMLVVDSTALQDENYSGIYDGTGDYIPQYCDDPEQIPRGALQANAEQASVPSSAGAETDGSSSTEENSNAEEQQ